MLKELRQHRSKHRSTSTSYLNEEDDYDNNFCSKEDLRTFRRQLSLEDNLNKLMGIEMAELSTENKQTAELENSEDPSANIQKKSKSNGNESSGSSRESSDTEYDSDNNEDLYAIDEYDECIATLECDPVELKKDPTGYHYKRIASNIYQELFTTKLFDKLWPQSSLSPSINASINSVKADMPLSPAALIGNNFSESFFEKLALMEFEASVYQQLKSAKILYTFYKQIVYNEIKMIKTKPSNTIMVTPVKSNEVGNENNLLSAEVKNLKSVRKKLSLTILELGNTNLIKYSQLYQVIKFFRLI